MEAGARQEGGRPQAPLPHPATIMAFLDEKAVELDSLGKQLEAAHIGLGDAEVEWEDALDDALLKIHDDCHARDERMPAADVRSALARRDAEARTKYGTYRRAKRLCEGLEKRGRVMDTAVSARQSTLKRLEAELNARTFDPQTGETFGGRR